MAKARKQIGNTNETFAFLQCYAKCVDLTFEDVGNSWHEYNKGADYEGVAVK